MTKILCLPPTTATSKVLHSIHTQFKTDIIRTSSECLVTRQQEYNKIMIICARKPESPNDNFSRRKAIFEKLSIFYSKTFWSVWHIGISDGSSEQPIEQEYCDMQMTLFGLLAWSHVTCLEAKRKLKIFLSWKGNNPILSNI